MSNNKLLNFNKTDPQDSEEFSRGLHLKLYLTKNIPNISMVSISKTRIITKLNTESMLLLPRPKSIYIKWTRSKI